MHYKIHFENRIEEVKKLELGHYVWLLDNSTINFLCINSTMSQIWCYCVFNPTLFLRTITEEYTINDWVNEYKEEIKDLYYQIILKEKLK